MSDTYKVQTSLGPLYLNPTDANHIYAHNGSNLNAEKEFPEGRRESPCVVRGVEIGVGIHLFRWSDGLFHIGRQDEQTYEQRRHLHATKINWTRYNDSDASESAKNKIAEIVVSSVNEWIKQTPQALSVANLEHLQNELDRAKYELETARESFTKAEQTYLAAKDALAKASA